MDTKPQSEVDASASDTTSPTDPVRKPYVTPVLTDFGAVVDKTHGATGAAGVDAGIYS